MYKELYKAWEKEMEIEEIQVLPKDFYTNVSEYIKKLKEERRALDEKSLNARLIKQELEKVNNLVKDLVHLRIKKIIDSAIKTSLIQTSNLAQEEEIIHSKLIKVADDLQKILEDILEGKRGKKALDLSSQPQRILIRFLREIPAIIGSDMKPYGPFKAEDVASLPIQNIETLIKHGIVKRVNVT
jgi:DNA replication factor GINS